MKTPEETTVRRRYEVRGRVQAVGFRAWMVRQARALGLSGTVCNLPGGTVEVEAAGAPEALTKLRALLSDGPAYADVREVQELEPRTTPLPAGFVVQY